jgi:ankyrin repeat protein
MKFTSIIVSIACIALMSTSLFSAKKSKTFTEEMEQLIASEEELSQEAFAEKIASHLNVESPIDLLCSLNELCKYADKDEVFNVLTFNETFASSINIALSKSNKTFSTLKNSDDETIFHVAARTLQIHHRVHTILRSLATNIFLAFVIMQKNKHGKTAFNLAAAFGNIDFAQNIFQVPGINLNEILFSQNEIGDTDLHTAVFNGHEEYVRMLLEIAGNNAEKLVLQKNNLDEYAPYYALNNWYFHCTVTHSKLLPLLFSKIKSPIDETNF